MTHCPRRFSNTWNRSQTGAQTMQAPVNLLVCLPSLENEIILRKAHHTLAVSYGEKKLALSWKFLAGWLAVKDQRVLSRLLKEKRHYQSCPFKQ